LLAQDGGEKPGAFTGMNATPQTRGATALADFLRDRRARLRPSDDAPARRRTPGLRREEVAARAGVSVTWYTWLEQGRGGPPSVQVLERLAGALELDGAGRELLFLLAQNRPAPFQAEPTPAVPPGVQSVLDALVACPALIKTRTWDIVAWNAATAVLADYASLPPRERNVLRRLFCDPRAALMLTDWEEHARFAVSVFRYDMARVGGSPEADALAAELHDASADFRRLWAENEVRSHGVGMKRFSHPELGLVTFQTAGFSVDGAEGLTMIVLTPAGPSDRAALAALSARAG
jgi:transcriptional regulator with XRE-family HTH domain